MILLAVAAVLSVPALAAAQELLAVGSPNFDGSSNLYRIEWGVSGPSAVDLGEIGLDVSDFTLDPSTGRGYGTDLVNLLQIDPVTLGVAVIGQIGGLHATLTADAQGQLFSWGGGLNMNKLFRVNERTGRGSLIGTVGFSGGQLAFAPDGRLFGIAGSIFAHQLVEIDPITGAGTVVGDLAASYLRGLCFLPDGRLLVASFDSIYTGISIALYEADPNTAALTFLGTIANSATLGLRALAWRADWLELSPPTPGSSGSTNVLKVTGLQAAERSWLLAAREEGSTPIPGCPPLHCGLAQPVVLGSLLANATGSASYTVTVPLAFSMRTVQFQCVAPASCRQSLMVTYTFS